MLGSGRSTGWIFVYKSAGKAAGEAAPVPGLPGDRVPEGVLIVWKSMRATGRGVPVSVRQQKRSTHDLSWGLNRPRLWVDLAFLVGGEGPIVDKG